VKIFNKLSLKLKLTIIIGLLLIAVCVALIIVSIFTAKHAFTISAKIGNQVALENQLKTNIAEQNSNFTFTILVFGSIITILGTGATYIIAGKVSKPITNLSKEIEKIDENNLFIQLQANSSGDEVAKLSHSFNHMINKLEKAFISQKNFSANVAHELKTPLACIIASIQVLQLDDNSTIEEYKETLDDTLKNAQRLSTLVNDMLEMNNNFDINRYQNFEAKEIFDKITEEFSKEIKNKNIEVENSIINTQLYGERSLLFRAFSNIIYNAVRYNKQNGEIKITAKSEDSNSVNISVYDTGIGIPEDEIDKIFEPFYCIDKSRSKELGGNGLGLYIVKSIIDKHKGVIKVQSEINVSTTIEIKLPKKI